MEGASDGGSLFTTQLWCAWQFATFSWCVGVAGWSNGALSPVHVNIHIDVPEAFFLRLLDDHYKSIELTGLYYFISAGYTGCTASPFFAMR